MKSYAVILGGGSGLFQLGEGLLHVDTGEEVVALGDLVGGIEEAPLSGGVPGAAQLAGTQLIEELVHALGHEGDQQDAADAGGLQQVIQHMGQALAVGLHILGQSPGSALVDILVGALDDAEHIGQSGVGGAGLHILFIDIPQGGGHGD